MQAHLLENPARWRNDQEEKEEVDEQHREKRLRPRLERAGLVVSELLAVAVAQECIGAQHVLAIDGTEHPWRHIHSSIAVERDGILRRIIHERLMPHDKPGWAGGTSESRQGTDSTGCAWP